MVNVSQNGVLTPGVRATARGDEWVVTNVTRHTDCRAVRVRGCGIANDGTVRTLLAPFDRFTPSSRSSHVRVVSRNRWNRHVSGLLLDAQPFGTIVTAASAGIELLPFQVEPALAMLRHACVRLLIADEVGLGKTIQTGVILRQLSSDIDGFRALILTPAGVREQWQQELSSRFVLPATIADAAWLVARTRELPAEVNPWSLPGTYIASLDLVKRPEVLRALEDVSWDVAVVDEVHSAGLATARLAAADAVARSARRVLLLTATPPDGDPAHFDAIANLGRLAARDTLTQFRRSRRDAGIHARRKSVLLPVRLSKVERRMHRLLNRYTLLVWTEAGTRHDARAKLAAIILRKRALSSAASLALSVRRRLMLLGTVPAQTGEQLLLPLGDEDPLADQLPDAVIGASGLADVTLERSCLEQIAVVAEEAARAESKLALLGRLLLRTSEPMIIFTEYRDTLARLAQLVGLRRPVLTLHGGMTPRERAGVQRAFNASGAVLLATDAASEGLNLHERCRLVVHFELPWTPARLEQRTGRVDRLGQARDVHEILLVARHTCERLVLAPLLKRARTAAARGGPSARVSSLTEAAVASAVMRGVTTTVAETYDPPAISSLSIREEAEAEVLRLTNARRLTAVGRTAAAIKGPRTPHDGLVVTADRRSPCRSILVIVEVNLERSDGRVVQRDLVPVVFRVTSSRLPGAARAVSRLATTVVAAHGPRALAVALESRREEHAAITLLYQATIRAAADRERDLAGATSSAAERLVQVGLFDARHARALAARDRAASSALLEADERLSDLPEITLRTTTRIVALRFARDPES